MNSPYDRLRSLGNSDPSWAWLLPLLDESDRIISAGNHGDLPRWLAALEQLPVTEPFLDGSGAAPEFGSKTSDREKLTELLMALHPWRKGPLIIGGVRIDTEWRSDLKWNRISKHIDLRGHRVLDIGCGNGYYGWRMLAQGAKSVIGVDPTLVFVMQWLACQHFCGDPPNLVLPLGVESLPPGTGCFDTVFSMGVLYHRRDPVKHLARLRDLLKPAGQLLLETLVLEGDENRELVPGERYARMRNVWSVPSISRLKSWIGAAGMRVDSVLDITRTTTAEQRTTPWMRFESLRECLDPENPEKTVEGHPAPVRAALLVRPD